MTVPDIRLPTLDGRIAALSEFRGGPVLVNFWASWCPPCREEFPVLAAARERHRAAGFEVVGISHNDGQAYALRYVAEVGASWPMLIDEANEAWRAFGAVGLPSSYLIDADGVLQRIHFGPLDEAQLEEHLAAVGMAGTDEQPQTEPSTGPR
jgi:cytochrome c biogenesis protein CcmG/thiol:disulfide interchange protein DsbE